MPEVKGFVTVDGKEYPVTFASPPTESDIDDAANYIRKSLKSPVPTNIKAGVPPQRVTPTQHPATSTSRTGDIPNLADKLTSTIIGNALAPNQTVSAQKMPVSQMVQNAPRPTAPMSPTAQTMAGKRVQESAQKRKPSTSADLRKDVNDATEKLAGSISSVIPDNPITNSVGGLFGRKMLPHALAGMASIPFSLFSELATATDPNESGTNQLGALANIAINVLPAEAIVGKLTGKLAAAAKAAIVGKNAKKLALVLAEAPPVVRQSIVDEATVVANGKKSINEMVDMTGVEQDLGPVTTASEKQALKGVQPQQGSAEVRTNETQGITGASQEAKVIEPRPKYNPPKEGAKRVQVGDHMYDLEGDALAEWTRIDATQAQKASAIRNNLKKGLIFEDEANAQLKTLAMQAAAEKRKIVGGLTGKELKLAETQANKLVPGVKAIAPDGRVGIVKSNAYGKVVLEFEDGSSLRFDRSELTRADKPNIGAMSGATKVEPIQYPEPAKTSAVTPPEAPVTPPTGPAQPPTVDVPTSGDIALKNAATEQIRARYGLSELPQPEAVTWTSLMEKANPDRALGHTTKTEALKDSELADILARLDQMDGEYKAALAAGDDARVSELLDEFDKLTKTTKRTGNETARALAFRKAEKSSINDLSPLNLNAQARAVSPKPISAKDEALFNSAEKKVADMDGQIDELTAKVDVELNKRLETQSKRRTKTPEQIKAERAKIIENIKKAQSKSSQRSKTQGGAIDTEVMGLYAQLAWTYVDAGLSKLDDVIAAVKSHFPDADERAIRLAMAGGYKRTGKVVNAVKQDVKGQARAASQIDSLTDQLRTDVLVPPKAKVKRTPSQELIDLMYERDQLKAEVKKRLEARRLAGLTGLDKAGHIANQIIGVPRSLMASADIGWVFRQNLSNTLAHPIVTAKAIGQSLASLNKRKAWEIQKVMKSDPVWRQMPDLHFSDLPGGMGANKEEFFNAAIFAEKLPVIGQVVSASDRNMAVGLNYVRYQLAKDYLKKFPNATKEELKEAAKLFNASTGRGYLGIAEPASGALATVFFSPRMMVSRFQVPLAILTSKNANVRKRALADMAKTVTVGMGVLEAAKMAGAEVSFDPSSSDFGKIKIGNNRIDIWGGYGNAARLIAKPIKELAEAGSTDPVKLVTQYLTYKTAPGISIANTLAKGQNMVGEPKTKLDVLQEAILPMTVTDIIQTGQREGWVTPEVAATLLGNTVGIGVQNYAPKTRDSKPAYMKGLLPPMPKPPSPTSK